MELRIVDPRKLRDSLDNPRKTQPGKEDDAQLVASIKVIGLRQPPLVKETEGTDVLDIVAGRRRVKAAIKAKLKTIYVLVQNDDDAKVGAMVAVAENVVRSDMGPVDRWRAMEALSGAGWTDEAIGISLNVTARNIAKLRLLGRICPAMLDHMAKGDMPDEGELRTIAAASTEDQAAVWSQHKPRRNSEDSEAEWWQIAKALSKDRVSAKAAKFSDEDAARFGIVWEEDLFAPAGEDSRTTTQVDEFMAAQQEWLEANMPENGVVVEMNRHGGPVLPKGAQQRYGEAGEGDMVAHYLDNGGNVRTAVYSPPPKSEKSSDDGEGEQNERKTRTGLTQKGDAMIGDLRTDALHQALRERPIDDETLIGMLVLALGSANVEIRPGVSNHYGSRGARHIAAGLVEGDVLSRDSKALRAAAREMLVEVLSCRKNMSWSGPTALVAGAAIDAGAFLPNMATEDFLRCLPKPLLETEADAANVAIKPRGKDTRAALVERFAAGTWVYPGARFELTDDERATVKAEAAEPDDDYDADIGDDETDPQEEGGGPDESDAEDREAA
jgi:ParB family chromosome partitioning protein